MSTVFKHLNPDWNAEPNTPSPNVTVHDDHILLAFYMNPFQFTTFKDQDVGYLRFENAWRYRLGHVTDETWYRGSCRFSKLAPAWGEFYEVSGDLLLKKCPNNWVGAGSRNDRQKHFLFYFRDSEFEVDAETWTLQVYNVGQKITMERAY